MASALTDTFPFKSSSVPLSSSVGDAAEDLSRFVRSLAGDSQLNQEDGAVSSSTGTGDDVVAFGVFDDARLARSM